MIDQLKDLKDTYEGVRSQIDRGKEPLEELITLHNFLKAVSENPSLIEDKMDKDYKRFFFDDFTQGLLKRLTRERSKNDKYLDIIAGIEECFIKIFVEELRKGHFNQQFFDSMKMVFEYDSILHNYNYQIPEDELKRLRNTNQAWRKELKQGDMIDAIVDENNRCSGWSQARISQVNGDLLYLEFIYDTKNADRYIDRWSVEIAQFETKTKEIFEWKGTLTVNAVVDAHDKTVWNKSTILDIKEQQISPDRVVKMAFIAYRIYVESGAKSDERGTYDGWSNRFDEWVSVYSPRIQPFYSKTQKGTADDVDLDEELDSQIKPDEGKDRVYAVPRLRKCTSSLFINLINLFGHLKGYDLILQCLDRDEELFDLNTLAILMQIVSIPYLIYHKEFIVEYGPKFVSVCKRRLRDAPEKSLRDVRREKIEAIIKSVDNLQRRLIQKEEREKETEVLRLEVSLMCLKSNFLERRIQGIRELNQIIKNNRMVTIKSFSAQFLIEWMQTNEVFNILFDTKKTHLQLVQRCTDILKLLLQEDMFSPQLMEMFWSLAKSDYKFEVYKIINDCSFYFKQPQIDFFFEQIRQVPPHKLAMEEFQCLSELGKYARDDSFKVKVSDFFWNVICNSDSCKEELVNSCITKFCEMVRTWDLAKKNEFFVQLTHNLTQNKSSISSLRLFKGLLKDQKERSTYNSSPSKGYYNNAASKEPEIQEIKTELTLNGVIDALIKEHQLITTILNNLKHYCQLVNDKIVTIPTESRKKLFFVNNKYSHHDEIDERLQFIKYLATISDYTISKVELGVIYDLLVLHSKIPSDQEEFLNWCKSSCEQSSALTTIMELNEVGEFFTQKMQSKELDVKNLLSVGFEFLQQYFLTANEKESKVFKSQKPVKAQKFTSMGYNYQTGSYGIQYGPSLNKGYYNRNQNQKDQDDEEDRTPIFKILSQPAELNQLDIVWNIALNCENPKVIPKAIDFLIKVYTCLDDDLAEKRIDIQDELIDKCMNIIRTTNDEFTIKRVIEILKNIIYEAEKKGTGDVKPHNALLKGELLNKIIVKNKASPKRGNIVMSIYSNATIWEFKKEVAKQLELAPKYLKIERNDGKAIKDIENGKTLAELGIQNNETFTAYKVNVEEEVANVPLTGPDGRLTEKARQIFNEWFDMYSDESGSMTRETCALFIKGCTGEYPSLNDERITNLFKNFDINNDGKIERQEFMGFYETASRNKPETVRENLRAHNIRNDLKKLSEIQEETSYKNTDMPRYKLSKHQEHFEILLSLLDRHDSASQSSWDLIQMLSTNETLYKRVLQLKNVEDPVTNKIDWSKFFDSNSLYKLLYTLQIIEAVMEEGEGEGLEMIDIIQEDSTAKKNIPKPPPLQGVPASLMQNQDEDQDHEKDQPKEDAAPKQPQVLQRNSSVVVENDEDEKLKTEWTSQFLKNNGFQYIMKVFMDKDIRSTDSISSFNQQFELKHIAFLLKLLRIFIMAAFSTSSESQVYAVASLVRKSSSYQEDEQIQSSLGEQGANEGSRFKDLQKLLQGPLGSEIIESIDYKNLQAKILKIIAEILVKEKMIFEDKLIIENALSLWVGCILHNNSLFNDFYTFKGEEDSKIKTCDDFVLNGLLFCSQEKVREEFKQSFSSLSHKLMSGAEIKQTPLFYLLKLLSQNFALISNYQCKQYFELFCELIDQYFMARNIIGGLQGEAFNPEQLLSLIIDKIKEYNKLASETGGQDQIGQDGNEEALEQLHNEQENIYIGLIQLTGKIIDNFDISFSEKIVESKNLIDEIFVQFLFASIFKQQGQNSLDTLRIKPKKSQRKQGKKVAFGKRSKDAAYKLLNSLIRKSPVLMNTFLEKSMLPLMKLIKRHEGWNYTPPGTSERSQKYVGLRNLGCICYMNAMMQQFFMIPAFRYNLLCVEDKMPQDLQGYKGQQIDDNVLHQLQKLMAHLELSERSDYNPFEFCFAFKDLDGNPTNTSEQKDAQEFLNLAFDRIENMLRGTSRKYLLQSVFGGKTCSQLLCTECGKVKNRIEDYYNLSLTVKDIKSMHDSLQKLIEGEVINDYECDGCKKKVDISKRTLISSTPNVLIVHLQRIIFNFDTFRNDKINSFFEFPYQLDLKPYSFYEVMKKENRLKKKNGEEGEDEEVEELKKDQQEDEDNQWPEEDDCFEYKLTGVVVHSGTANAGHYWSYINTKRGFQEPSEEDPNWNKTENDPWMEFNDSTVREFNFDKLKEEGFGGDGKSGNDDAWSFGGSYGKSAYMLVYERKKKRPLKILVNKEDVEAEKAKNETIHYDEKKEEYYKLIDYREGVEDIAPNQIYKQVFEDNQKFEFENDIYSSEFFEFVNGILKAVVQLDQDRKHPQQLMSSVKENALSIGKKTVLEILSKCFHNQPIKDLVTSLIEIFKRDEQMCVAFMQQCMDQDDGNYLLELLLECIDVVTRNNVSTLLKHILNTLKISEKDQLYETETIEVENDKGEKSTITRPKALSARFILKCFSVLTTMAAKNWSRFDNFLELLYSFGFGERELSGKPEDAEKDKEILEEQKVGIEFYFRNRIIEKACDFLLGRKSPLCEPSHKRIEMGGSFTQPNFSPIIKLITNLITQEEYINKYQLSDLEKKMLLHNDLLKVMLGSSQGSKQFGQCLANMCKDNVKLSKKVSKVFIKSINGSNFDNVKNYLTALKPFIKLNDSIKAQKLEWVFGFNQIIAKKGYREEKFKYGLEFVDKINEEAYQYLCPLLNGPVDDALLSQLLKCKGKLDTFAINCLKEMLSLMAKDDDIARFVYFSAPPTYQHARYSDWIKPYLEHHKADIERNNAYSYFKNKHDTILKTLSYFAIYDEKCKKFAEEEKAQYEKLRDDGQLTAVQEDWLCYQSEEIIPHFPPQLIIGRQVGEDKEYMVYDEDPRVKVTVMEVTCEYNYSNPTGWFNLSLPHIDLRTNNYQTVSYAQYRKMQVENERRNQQHADGDDEDENTQAENPQEETRSTASTTVIQDDIPIVVRNWFENKKEAPVLLKVYVTNKLKSKVSVKVSLESTNGNIICPKSFVKDVFIDNDTKYIIHLQKVDPTKEWGSLIIKVDSHEKNPVPAAPTIITTGNFDRVSTQVQCRKCHRINDADQPFCDACGDDLSDNTENIMMEHYFHA